jgi:hypothetical protein
VKDIVSFRKVASVRDIRAGFISYDAKKARAIRTTPGQATAEGRPPCEPSQKGGFFVCLQLQSQTVAAFSNVNFMGAMPLPL